MALPQNNVPHYTLTMPTSKAKIKYRPFLVGEQKVALMAADSGVDSITAAMRQIVDRCTFEKLDVDNMPDFEVEWLFLQIRMRSAGETIEMVVTCQHCDQTHDYMLDLTKVELHIDPEHSKKIMLADEMGVEMMYPTSKQIEDLNKDYNATTVYNTIKACMKSVFTLDEVHPVKDETDEEIERWLSELTGEQFAKIEKFFATMPVVKHTFDEECPACFKTTRYTMEGVDSFFA